jgi:hypothetical protein
MGDILLCPILTTTMGRHRTQPPFIDGRLIMTESTQRPWSYELSMDKENWIEDMEESRENLEGLVQRLTIQNDALVAALETCKEALMNVPVVGEPYDQQHSDFQMHTYNIVIEALEQVK